MTFNKEIREVAQKLGEFYLQKHDGDIERANDEICKCGFRDLVVNEDSVEIHMTRPGIFIGRRGENVEKVVDWLGTSIRIVEANSIEDHIYQHGCPYEDYLLD